MARIAITTKSKIDKNVRPFSSFVHLFQHDGFFLWDKRYNWKLLNQAWYNFYFFSFELLFPLSTLSKVCGGGGSGGVTELDCLSIDKIKKVIYDTSIKQNLSFRYNTNSREFENAQFPSLTKLFLQNKKDGHWKSSGFPSSEMQYSKSIQR